MMGGNMQSLMRQAQKLQKQMKADQEALNAQTFTGAAPDDMVTVTATGEHKVTDIVIKPEAIDPDDPDMLSDMVLAAVNDVMTKVDEATNDTMGKYSRGMGM
ncbi:YbaB/EbfC family nucleoid-associated protein [Furfurilactobacillus sp. WILCCON 0119]|uniref:YbaB/EbfC family nucleoid-associated protein n=1 Tax=Furfurilactobacillus entadae TaxID=2922307 RepID=UPI0035EA5D32